MSVNRSGLFQIVSLLSLASSALFSSTRYLDPVVLTGSDVPSLLGCEECVSKLVAFAWINENWIQAPVQVDERHIQDFFIIKNGQCILEDRNLNFLVYADAGTFSGRDENPSLDEDDEIVFMAKDVGDRFDGESMPSGVVNGVFEELEVNDPLGGVLGYMYLFISDGSLAQDAGTSRIQYVFNLTNVDENGSNDYFDVYHWSNGGNPEDSFFQSSYYRRHFLENWNSDSVNIFAGESTGEDIMAHQDFQFTIDNCGRCVSSFTHGATGFIANKEGPVRAIRSWVGANSGAITQRETIMYEQREDVRTFLRVHPIPGIMDYVTYKEDLPLVYYNCKNKEGIIVDGDSEDDSFDKYFCPWEYVTGRAGTLLRTYLVDTDLGDVLGIPDDELAPFVLDGWFYDNRVPENISDGGVAIHPNGFHQCSTKLTEQKSAWGTHGVKTKAFLPGLPNTDPNRAPHEVGENTPEGCGTAMKYTLNKLDLTNSYYYLPPGLEVDIAEQIYLADLNPLVATSKTNDNF